MKGNRFEKLTRRILSGLAAAAMVVGSLSLPQGALHVSAAQNPVAGDKLVKTANIQEMKLNEEETAQFRNWALSVNARENSSVFGKGYYYSLLTGDEKLYYDALEQVINYPLDYRTQDDTIEDIMNLDENSVAVVYENEKQHRTIELDAMEIMYAYMRDHVDEITVQCCDVKIRQLDMADGTCAAVIYIIRTQRYQNCDFEQMHDDLIAARDRLVASIDTTQPKPVQEMEVHDYFTNNVPYKDSALEDAGDGLAHTAYGALVDGTCVCDGFSDAFRLCLSELGITALNVGSSSHEWSIVNFDNDWYVVDVTWDLKDSGDSGAAETDTGKYEWFNITEDQMAELDSEGSHDLTTTSRRIPFNFNGTKYNAVYVTSLKNGEQDTYPGESGDEDYTQQDSENAGAYQILDEYSVRYTGTGVRQEIVDTEDIIVKNGEVYAVTEVADRAHKGDKTMKLLVIGSFVDTIGKKAFCNAKNVEEILIFSDYLENIGKDAFKGIGTKKTVEIAIVCSDMSTCKKTKKLIKKNLDKGAKVKFDLQVVNDDKPFASENNK